MPFARLQKGINEAAAAAAVVTAAGGWSRQARHSTTKQARRPHHLDMGMGREQCAVVLLLLTEGEILILLLTEGEITAEELGSVLLSINLGGWGFNVGLAYLHLGALG